MFGSDVNGLVNSIAKFLSYISLFEAGFGGVVQYLLYKPIANKNKKEVVDVLTSAQQFFKKVCLVFILYVLLLCIFYPYAAQDSFNNYYVISLILIIAISTLAEYYFGLVYKVYLLARQQKYIPSIFQIVTYTISIVAVVLLSHSHISIQLFETIVCIIFIVRPILQGIYVRKKYNIKLNGNKKYIIRQKWDALAQHIASVIHNSTDVVVLTFFCDISEVSVYSVYYMVVYGVRSIASVFYDSLNSIFGDIIAKKETKKLKESFDMTESLYFSIVGVLFSCAIVLIVPFVKVYMNGVTDANYDRPLFAVLLVLSEFVWAIRLPFSSIALAAGHYKQTRRGAILECVTNIIISVVLVSRYGIIGVAIGTLVAMFVRTVEFVLHTNRYVVKRSVRRSVSKIVLLCFQVLAITLFFFFVKLPDATSFSQWIIDAIVVLFVSVLIVVGINCLVYKKDFLRFSKQVSGIIHRRKKV